MPESISISIEVIDKFTSVLKSFEKSFNTASSAAIDSLKEITEEIDALRESIDQLNLSLARDLNKVSLQDLAVEIGTIIAAASSLYLALERAHAYLALLSAQVFTIYIGFRLGWEVGTWLNDNVLIPIQKWFVDRDRNLVNQAVKEFLDPTEALDEINAIYRRAGDDVEKFASMGVGAFETLRSHALSEVEQMRSGIERLRFNWDMFSEAGRDRLEQLQRELSQGEKLLEYLDKHRQAIHVLSGENNSLTGTYERLSQSVLDTAAGIGGIPVPIYAVIAVPSRLQSLL